MIVDVWASALFCDEVANDAEALSHIFLYCAEVAHKNSIILGFGHEETSLCDSECSQLYINSVLLSDLQLLFIFAVGGQFLCFYSKTAKTFHDLILGKSTSIISNLNVIVLHLQSIVWCFLKQIAHLLKIAAFFGLVGVEVLEL